MNDLFVKRKYLDISHRGNKSKQTYRLVRLFYCAAISLILISCANNSNQSSKSASPQSPAAIVTIENTEPESMFVESVSNENPIPEVLIIPKGYDIYQTYLDATNGRAPRATSGVIEGTILILNRGEMCPYAEEKCSVTPYPLDTGIVLIEEILEYTRYEDRPLNPVEASSESEGEVTGSEQNIGQGIEIERRSVPDFAVGQEVEARFLLTASPATVKYEPISPQVDSEAQSQPDPTVLEIEVITEGGELRSLEAHYPPIPRANGLPIFTIQIGNFQSPIEKLMPGLQEGARFRAKFDYTGILFIEEYELLN